MNAPHETRRYEPYYKRLLDHPRLASIFAHQYQLFRALRPYDTFVVRRDFRVWTPSPQPPKSVFTRAKSRGLPVLHLPHGGDVYRTLLPAFHPLALDFRIHYPNNHDIFPDRNFIPDFRQNPIPWTVGWPLSQEIQTVKTASYFF